MTIKVALHHRTRYNFDRPVTLSAHEVRLRPASHARTPVESYSLKVLPAKHFLNWQQDPYGNWVARLVFPEVARHFEVNVDLVADLTVINPFDFFVDPRAEHFPFAYSPENARELAPYLEKDPLTPRLAAWIDKSRAKVFSKPIGTVNGLVALNQILQGDVRYLIRMEPGIQTPERTLERGEGSCRDSAWMLVQVLRHLGIAARFASGYLIQLVADVKPLDGPAGTTKDFTDLHAWCEAYIPGAGWIGLDPTSGLLTGEGHIPLACTALPSSAAPVTGYTDPCESTLEFEMTVTRIHEDPRVTRPFTEEQWSVIDALGAQVDRELAEGDVRLTQGGEPTFVSIDDMEGPEWNHAAHSPRKFELATELVHRLRARFSPGGLLHFGQGKWYPAEPLPRWAITSCWRRDGAPLWSAEAEAKPRECTAADALRLAEAIASNLGLPAACVLPAYEDPWKILQGEANLPENVDPLAAKLGDPAVRDTLREQLAGAIGKPIGYVLPLRPEARAKASSPVRWQSSPWPLKRGHVFALEGDSPLGYRLPLASLPKVLPEDVEPVIATDPFEPRAALAARATSAKPARGGAKKAARDKPTPRDVIRTALCIEPRGKALRIFLPPLPALEDFVALIGAIEASVTQAQVPVELEGYPPPEDPRLGRLAVTPDPGVIEVNIHPSDNWEELKATVTGLYEDARQSRLATEKFMLDGRHTGTGGGNHVTLGAKSAAESPLLRRPDLLRSLIAYWQNHPSLSYLFSGTFVGPTSQAPRVDEARSDTLYELEIAFEQLEAQFAGKGENEKPWLVDRILRNFLVDLTGNTHRAEFSIDKLYAPGSATGRLGLLEFRAFEMPPHARMSLLQLLLLRALVARFWKDPYRVRLVHWGTRLHDEFMLPHFVAEDFRRVIDDLELAGYPFRHEWFAAFFEFRFPRYGAITCDGTTIELRQAIEPWHVLGEEVAQAATARYVDSSLERLQVKASRLNESRHAIACNGRLVPMTPTAQAGDFVAGVRYKAWAPSSALHPTIAVHSPLVFDLVDLRHGRSLGGCTYYVSHPGGRNYDTFPVNALEAEARRVARFNAVGHTPGPMTVAKEARNPRFPVTLDLRREPEEPRS